MPTYQLFWSGTADGALSAKHGAGAGEVPRMNLGDARRITFPSLPTGTWPMAEGNLHPAKASKGGGAFHNQDPVPRF